MEAFNFYNTMAGFYFDLAVKNKGILPAAKACYIIAAENLHQVKHFSNSVQVNQLISDEIQVMTNKKKIKDIITLVEGINQKIQTDIQFDPKKAKLMEFDQKERTIIEAGSYLKGHKFEIWSPEMGITK